MRNSRCGLRGVRLGEASNPGPPGRCVRESAEEVLDSLERELTLIESDDEPLVRVATGRIHAVEPGVVHSDSLATVPASPRALQGVVRCEVPDVAPPTLPALPAFPTWVDQDLDESSSMHSESCWGGMVDRNDEEVGGLLPAVVDEVREVASQVPVPVVWCWLVAEELETRIVTGWVKHPKPQSSVWSRARSRIKDIVQRWLLSRRKPGGRTQCGSVRSVGSGG